MKIILDLDAQEINALLAMLDIQAKLQLDLSLYRQKVLIKTINILSNTKDEMLIKSLGLLKKQLFLPAPSQYLKLFTE